MQRRPTSPQAARIALDLELLEPRVLLSAVFGAEQLIATGAAGVNSVCAADLDGDGAPDVLSASPDTNTLAWYENLGGGSFGPARTITAASGGVGAVYAADLNGDGRPDVLSVSSRTNEIAWYENLGGGQFGPKRTIAASQDGVFALDAADLDGDGDLDVLAAANKTTWFENLGGGIFAPRQVISSSGGLSVATADLDGDGDLDVLSTSLEIGDSYDFTEKIVWYANLGGGSFSPKHTISKSGSAAYSTIAADLNADGRPDVLSLVGSRIQWSENLGAGAFGARQAVAASAGGTSSVAAADLNGDGLADVLAVGGGGVAWYRNLGGGGFGAREVVAADGASSAVAADLDGDGAFDVLAASGKRGTISWYRNLGESGPGDVPPQLDSYVGVLSGSGAGRVYVYDTVGPVDVGLADVTVQFDKSGNVATISLVGSRPTEGLSLVVAGGSPAGITVKDGRKGAAGAMGFLVCDAPIKSMKLKGGLVGSDVAPPAAGRVALPGGFDGADCAIYTSGWLGTAQVAGSVTGDVWIGGSDAAGLAFKSFQSSGGDFRGDFRAQGAGGTLAFGGVLHAGSTIAVDGLLKGVRLGASETDNGGAEFGIFAGGFSKLAIGAWRLGPLNLPFAAGDFRVAVN